MIRRRIERIELQWNIAGIDDVVIRTSRHEHAKPALINVLTHREPPHGTFLYAKN